MALGIDVYNGSPKWKVFTDGLTFVANQAINRVFKAATLAPNYVLKFKKTTLQMNKLILEIIQDRREKLKQFPKSPEVSSLNFIFQVGETTK